MSERDGNPDESTPERGVDRGRRRFLRLAGGGALGLGGARVGYEVTGYGRVFGTNLPEQDLAPLAARRLDTHPFDLTAAGTRLRFDGDAVTLHAADGDRRTTVPVADATPDEAADAGAAYGVSSPLRALSADLDALDAGDVAFEFLDTRAFFDRLADARTRPFTVATLRGEHYRQPSATTVRAFTGRDPRDPEALVDGLADGFREHSHFDVTRYVVGLLQDYLLFDTVPLRAYDAESTAFHTLLDGSTGLYCWEYTVRAIEAFHVAPPHRQTAPVLGAIVRDDRHNHMYAALASAVRADGGLVVPMTFLDYSHSTMYDTYRLRWAFGDGVDAYDDQHRASAIHYSNA
ncbi:hypothetical protein [Halocalculus aciditolerans]|uniref:Uncharacterized protein n=1 Tax=Halocalculus aciditolerans TaxID=1383812 RepID=A0A830FEM5_9EURY|nr:hypothetical protein [Halocalculus aciditolerans]GGL67789.1 hypothetical protein GCM10009039_27200 [Halocalculus aciditolerans]